MLYRFQRATLEEAESRKYGALLQSEIRFLERETRHAKTVEESTKILRHDLRHFTRLIQGSLDRGDLDSARQVTALLEEKASALMRAGDLKRYTGRPLLDTVLSQAQERARELGAGFTVGVDLPDHLPMEDAELAVTFSNALENALNAVAQEPPGAGRWVAVHGKNLGSQYLLEFANAFSGQVELDSKTSLPPGRRPGPRLRHPVHRPVRQAVQRRRGLPGERRQVPPARAAVRGRGDRTPVSPGGLPRA